MANMSEALEEIAQFDDELTQEIEDYNDAHPDDIKDVISLADFLDENDYGLSAGQKTNIVNTYATADGNFTTTENGGYAVYKNQYVMVTNPTGEGDEQTCDEINQLNNELAAIEGQIKAYDDKKNVNSANKQYLQSQLTSLQNDYNEVLNTDASEYHPKNDGLNSIVFNDIDPETGKININIGGAENIEGDRTFLLYAPGVRIDNYSTRSVVFNDVDINGGIDNYGLIIDGVAHPALVQRDIIGFTVNNYYRTPIDPKTVVVTDNFDVAKVVDPVISEAEFGKFDIENQSYTPISQINADFASDVKIMSINRTGAVLLNSDNWQTGEEHELELTIDGQKTKVKFVVAKVERNLATIKFVDLPPGLANKIAYLYMKVAQSN